MLAKRIYDAAQFGALIRFSDGRKAPPAPSQGKRIDGRRTYKRILKMPWLFPYLRWVFNIFQDFEEARQTVIL
ncbi:MAG: hypothetical protein CSA68_11185 [Rhodobacterales bacterium]|nr:MAG: hypothetical protein CSA68_11185 [Rhodobacterales bacterium]